MKKAINGLFYSVLFLSSISVARADYIYSDLFVNPVPEINIARTLAYLGGGDPYCFSGLNGNTQTDFNNMSWEEDVGDCYGRPKPSWSYVQSSNFSAWNMMNEIAKQKSAYQISLDVPVLKAQMIEAQASILSFSPVPLSLNEMALGDTVGYKTLASGATGRSVMAVSTGGGLSDLLGDGSTNKAFTSAKDTKLSGIASGATVNSTDATLLARANHTGTQAQSTVVNLETDIANRPQVYFGSTKKSNAIMFTGSSTVGSGVAVFYLTTDGTSGGTAIFPTAPNMDSVNAFVSDSAASYQMSYALTNSNKTLTVTANKLTTSNILTGVLGQAAANSAVVRLTVWGS